MNELVMSFKDAGPILWAMLALALGGGLWMTVGSAVLVFGKRRVPPLLLLAPLGLMAMLTAYASVEGYRQTAFAAARASAEMKMTLMAAGISSTLGCHVWLGVLSLCAAPLAVICGLAVFTSKDRNLHRGVQTAILGLALFGVVFLNVILDGASFAALRLAVYAGLLVCAVGATLSDNRDAAVTATALVPLMVGALEASSRSWLVIDLFSGVARAAPEFKGALLVNGMSKIESTDFTMWLAWGIGLAIAVMGLRGLDEHPGWGASAVGAVGLSLGVPALWWLDAGLSLQVLAGMLR